MFFVLINPYKVTSLTLISILLSREDAIEVIGLHNSRIKSLQLLRIILNHEIKSASRIELNFASTEPFIFRVHAIKSALRIEFILYNRAIQFAILEERKFKSAPRVSN